MQKVFIYILAYLIGQLLFAHIVGRLFYRKNVFQLGSGNPGARNAGRSFGKWGFLLVLIGDMLKAFFVCWLVDKYGIGIIGQSLALIFVLLGHMYPVIYKFKGGKGVASFIGGLLYISPFSTFSFIGAFIILFAINRSFTKSGLLAIMTTPIFLYLYESNLWVSIAIAIIAIIIILRHTDKKVIVGDGR
ncbi:glycerol-3-phosphate acyltransferase [Heyndrickxia vini]|uniref:Glycerol-3-phosphate acyltransferase n=1 Tax=Heyndrickxia vini TaxID=1476025 RepID=A0ABX7DY89_9BACI|nr:glycerol-3-phosphate acyltransferase [Heyndrickxia vini]QQZ07895.1 glycerol-3-phosphate acyltransferase [Heyndrickxia vini]